MSRACDVVSGRLSDNPRLVISANALVLRDETRGDASVVRFLQLTVLAQGKGRPLHVNRSEGKVHTASAVAKDCERHALQVVLPFVTIQGDASNHPAAAPSSTVVMSKPLAIYADPRALQKLAAS